MRLPLTIIAVALNIMVFTMVTAFLMGQINQRKIPMLSTCFFTLMDIGIALNTVLICTAR